MNEIERIQDAIATYRSRRASLGGIARAQRLTAEQRKDIAKKAAKASAKVRSEKSKKKRTMSLGQ
jgi:hypothetical protein